MKKIVITGATSFIGLSIVKAHLALGDKVFAVVHPGSSRLSNVQSLSCDNLVIIECDSSEYSKIEKKIGTNIDIFYHFAWGGTRGLLRQDEKIQQNNYTCSVSLLNSVRNLNCRVFVDAGSQAEYGNAPLPQKENGLKLPTTAYGRQKLSFSTFANAFCKGNNIRYVHPRFFSVYGPGDDKRTMTMSIIDKMLKNQDCCLTEATQLWNYLFIDDLDSILLSVIQNTSFVGEINIAGNVTKPLKEFVKEMKETIHSSSQLLFGSIVPSNGLVSIYPDISTMMSLVGSFDFTPFSKGIKKTSIFIKNRAN